MSLTEAAKCVKSSSGKFGRRDGRQVLSRPHRTTENITEQRRLGVSLALLFPDSNHEQARRVALPNASFIAFTGTPFGLNHVNIRNVVWKPSLQWKDSFPARSRF